MDRRSKGKRETRLKSAYFLHSYNLPPQIWPPELKEPKIHLDISKMMQKENRYDVDQLSNRKVIYVVIIKKNLPTELKDSVNI